jgi:hypothetical protein
MQIPLSKILGLLGSANPVELRRSAILVLSELGIRDGAVTESVLAALADEDHDVRLGAITAAGKLKIDKALPLLAERIKVGGSEAERGAQVAARLGAKGSKMLHELMPHVAPGLRRYIAAALASAGASGGGDVTELEILLDRDPAVVSAAVQSLASAIPNLDARRKKAVALELLELVGSKNTKLTTAGEAGVVRLAGLLDDERVVGLLWDRVVPPHPHEVRASALSALGKWVESPNKEQRARLFRCAGEGDFRVAAPALMLLDKLPVNDKIVPEWLPLFRCPGLASRRLALVKVGHHDSSEVAEALMGQINHPDRGFREEVLDCLSKTEYGRKALAQRLHEAESAEEAWPLARVLGRLAPTNPEAWMDELFPQTTKYLEAGDRRADPFLFVLREGSAASVRDRLEKRAVALVSKKAFDAAHLVYRALARDPVAGFPYRLGVATCGLKVSPKELGSEARTHDPCLGQFAELAHQDSSAVLGHLEKTTWLDAEELYYLGFHFTESTEDALRQFGAAVLQLLVKRFPRVKLASAARNKLESAGLVEKKGKRGAK